MRDTRLAHLVREGLDAAGSGAHSHAKLPAGLKQFRPLSEEQNVQAARSGLAGLELAVALNPSSEEVIDELRRALNKLAEATGAVVAARTEQLSEAAQANLVRSCQEAIAAGNRDFLSIYDGVLKVIQSGESGGLHDYETAIGALRAAISEESNTQRDEAADIATLLADAAHSKPAFDVIVRALSDATGARLELPELGGRDRRGNASSGLKAAARIVEKVQLRPGDGRGKAERVCDVVRAMLIATDMATVAAIAHAFVALSRQGIVTVTRLKDRFAAPSAGGWRDLMINFVVTDDPRRHVCEVQVAHEMMLTARKGLPGHAIYAIVRNAQELIESCGLEEALRRQEVNALKGVKATVLEVLAGGDNGWICESAEWAHSVKDRVDLASRLTLDDVGCVIKIDLDELDALERLPDSIGDLRSLARLQVCSCPKLLALPERLGDCVSLTELDVSDCCALKALPRQLGRCQSLTTLDASGCSALSCIPEELCDAVQLEVLRLGGCDQVATLPFNIYKLSQLRDLALHDLPLLKALPQGVCELEALEVLDLSDCPSLAALPDRLHECRSLTELNLSGNPLLIEMPECICKLPALRELDLSRCIQLTSLSEAIGGLRELRSLDLSECERLEALPADLSECTRLNDLFLSSCSCLRDLPDLSALEAQINLHEDDDWPPIVKVWHDSPTCLRSLTYSEFMAYTRHRQLNKPPAPAGRKKW